jgi:hypothetical protein
MMQTSRFRLEGFAQVVNQVIKEFEIAQIVLETEPELSSEQILRHARNTFVKEFELEVVISSDGCR